MSRLPSIRDDDAEDAAKIPLVPPHLLDQTVRSRLYIQKLHAEAHAWTACKQTVCFSFHAAPACWLVLPLELLGHFDEAFLTERNELQAV